MTAGVVVDVGNTVYSLVLDKVGNRLNESLFVNLIGKLGDNNAHSAVFVFFDFCPCPDGNFASARRISGTDSGATHDNTGGRKVRSFDVLHEFF